MFTVASAWRNDTRDGWAKGKGAAATEVALDGASSELVGQQSPRVERLERWPELLSFGKARHRESSLPSYRVLQPGQDRHAAIKFEVGRA